MSEELITESAAGVAEPVAVETSPLSDGMGVGEEIVDPLVAADASAASVGQAASTAADTGESVSAEVAEVEAVAGSAATVSVGVEGVGEVAAAAGTPEVTRAAVSRGVALQLEALKQQLDESTRTLHKTFADKLALDRHKEQQIDALHAEVQEHKRGLLARATRPLLTGLVRLHDSLGRMVEDLRREPPEELTPERFYGILEGFQDDVEIVLDDQGVSLFLEPCERFEPRRQTSRQTIESDDEERVGTIARRVRPGFEQNEILLQKERVDVYVRARPSSPERGEASIETSTAESEGA